MSELLTSADFTHDPFKLGKGWLALPKSANKKDLADTLAALAQEKWPMRVAYLDDEATLIANLRVWENLILPVWRRDGGRAEDCEPAVVSLFDVIAMPQAARENLVKQLPAMLSLSERRLVVLLRALLLDPACVMIEENFWRELSVPGEAYSPLFERVVSVPCVLVLADGAAPAAYTVLSVKSKDKT